MKIKKSLSLLLILALLTGVISACAPKGFQRIKIAILYPEGVDPDPVKAKTLTEANLASVTYITEFALKGYTEKHTVEFVFYPIYGDMLNNYDAYAKSQMEAMKLALADPQTVAIVSMLISPDPINAQALPLANKANVAYFTVDASPQYSVAGFVPGAPGMYFPTGRRNLFRVSPRSDADVSNLPKHLSVLFPNTPMKNIYMVYPEFESLKLLIGVQRQSFEENQIQVTTLAYDLDRFQSPEIDDYTREMAGKIVDAKPDALILRGYPALAYAVREKAPDLPIVMASGGSMLLPGIPKGYNSAQLNGIFRMANFLSFLPNEIGSQVAIDFYSDCVKQPFLQAQGGPLSESDVCIANVQYEAVRYILTGVSRTQTLTHENLLDSLYAIDDYEGIFGKWHFTPNGDMSVILSRYDQLLNGEWIKGNIVRSEFE